MAQSEAEDKSRIEITGLIPEVYYDLIARVPAGTLLLLFAIGTLLSERGSRVHWTLKLLGENGVSAVVAATLMAGIGGILGILISPIAGLVRSLYWHRCWSRRLLHVGGTKAGRCLRESGWLRTSKQDEAVSIQDGAEIHQLDRWLYDYLLVANPVARSILPKLRAEADLCSYMGASFLLMPFVHLAITMCLVMLEGPSPGAARALRDHGTYMWYGLSGCMLVPLCLSGAFRTNRMIMRMLGMLEVICEREQVELADTSQQPPKKS